MTDRRSVAIHEAGHAVIGRVVGLPCGLASIVPDDDLECEGRAIVGDADTAWNEWQLREKFRGHESAVRARIIAAQAGYEAEAEIVGQATGNDDDDREVAAACAEDLSVLEDREAAALDRLRRAARHLVRWHRGEIERVAAALQDHQALTGDEIDALLPPMLMSRPVTWDLVVAQRDKTEVVNLGPSLRIGPEV